MFRSIFDDLKREFANGNMITRIIFVNVGVFIFVNIVKLILNISYAGRIESSIYQDFIYFFSSSTNIWHNLTHPWVWVTCLFLHEDFFHLLWNMLFLMWFGRIVGDFIGNQRVLLIYLLGGFAGVLFYILSKYILPYGYIAPYAYGASASVMAFVVAAAKLSPNYLINVILIGDVKLKYIALVFFVLDLVGIANNSNTGGHFGHIGGALMGWIYIVQLREGNDWAIPFNNFFDWFKNLFSNRSDKFIKNNPKMSVRHNPNITKKPNATYFNTYKENQQEKLDAILDKIKVSGYDNLSQEDKDFLFQISKK